MNKKIINQFHSDKGITGTDVVVAMLIILTTIGVISMVYVNLVLDSKETDRKTGATRIATNIIENLNAVYYDEIQEQLDQLVINGTATQNDNAYAITGQENTKIFGTTIPKGYKAIINVQNLEHDVVQKINVKIEYLVDGQTQNIELSKVFEREVIRECNSPNFTDEYIRQMIPENLEFETFSEHADSIQPNVKIICPIQYDKEVQKYKIVDVSTNQIWYSYANKNWARVLVLESSEVASNIDMTTKTIPNKDIVTSEKCYVWIPRFGVKNTGDLFGDTYFKYKDTNFAILNSYNNDFIYNYLDLEKTISWSERGISFETNELSGKWIRYSDISTVSTDAYYLNHSQYGPLMEY